MSSVVQQQTVYLNGQYLPMSESQISTQDRGFLFGDGVYEVIPVYQRHPFCMEAHLTRLENSLQAVSIANPHTRQEWRTLLQTLIDQHPWEDQYLYLQVTRGVQMQRDHLPADCLTPTVYAYTNPLKPIAEHIIQHGIKVALLEDIRWLRCDIKAITLLPNVMLKLAAQSQDADDAILVGRDGYLSEGTASNVFVIKDSRIITPPNSHKILPGITRMVIIDLAKSQQMSIEERPIHQQELQQADEIWLSSSTKEALPVTELDGHPIGKGQPGPVWHQLQQFYQQHKQQFIEAAQQTPA